MTSTEYANAALGHLGAVRIMDFYEQTPDAEHVRRMWDTVRDSLLRQRHWNFALQSVILSRLLDAPPFGWRFAYQLPLDHLLTVEFNGRPGGTGQARYEVIGQTIQTNDAEAHLRYVRRVETATEWDASFGEVFAYRLAAAICPAMTSAPGLADSLLQRSEQLLLRAFGPDNLETRPRAILAQSDSGWLQARRGGWRG